MLCTEACTETDSRADQRMSSGDSIFGWPSIDTPMATFRASTVVQMPPLASYPYRVPPRPAHRSIVERVAREPARDSSRRSSEDQHFSAHQKPGQPAQLLDARHRINTRRRGFDSVDSLKFPLKPRCYVLCAAYRRWTYAKENA